MESVFVMAILFVVGAMMGSFACCQAWRIRKGDKSKWSHCMHCKYQLQWYDNIPILSWLSLGGKCRKCKKKIGWAEFLAEIGTAVVFCASYLLWPNFVTLKQMDGWEMAKFGLFLVMLVLFAVMFVYDAKWQELPVGVLYGSWCVALVYLVVNVLTMDGRFDWVSLGGALMILPGFYYLMYKVSHESWVGGGDWMLCMSLALMLGNYWLSMFAMFLANMLGCVIMLPMTARKKNRKMRIPFGPFLMTAFWLIFIWQGEILRFIGTMGL